MLEISPEKIAHIIIRAREYDSGVNAWAHSGQRIHGAQGVHYGSCVAGDAVGAPEDAHAQASGRR